MSLCSSVFRVSGCQSPLRRQPISLLAHQQAGKANFYVLQHTFAKYPPQNLAYTQVSPTFAPLDIKFSRPSAHRQISTFARQRAQTVMSAARERKIARFFLHAATRWHSASYDRFKRNSRKFLQNFFAKNLVCVPKVRTFALAKQKWGLQHLTNLKQFDLWKHYIKLFCREVQETKWALFI